MAFQSLANLATLLTQRTKLNANFAELYGVAFEDDVTEATLPAAGAGNLGRRYFVTDRRGGCIVKSNGTSMVEQGPAINDVTSLTQAASFSSLPASPVVGQLIRVTDIGNNPNVLLRFNGTTWAPESGMQLLYSLQADVDSASDVTQAITFPTVTIPGGLLGPRGQLRIDGFINLSAAASTRTILMDWDGTELMNDTTVGRRAVFRRDIVNGTAATQSFPFRSTEYGAELTASTTCQTATKNTAASRTINGSVASTSAVAGVMSLKRYDVWLIGV